MQIRSIASPSRLFLAIALAAIGGGAQAAGACDSAAGKRFAYEVQGVANIGSLSDMPFAAVGRWAFDATGAAGTDTQFGNGSNGDTPWNATAFTCANLKAPKGFGRLTLADGRAFDFVPNAAANVLELMRADVHVAAAGEARLADDWSTLPQQGCSVVAGKTYLSHKFGAFDGVYDAGIAQWTISEGTGSATGVDELSDETAANEAGTHVNCWVSPLDGAPVLSLTDAGGNDLGNTPAYPSANGAYVAFISNTRGRPVAGWMIRR